jgi:hypothetical protein
MVAQNKYEIAFSHEYKRNKTKREGEKKKNPYLTSSCFPKKLLT